MDAVVQFRKTPWMEQVRMHTTPLWKRIAYRVARPFISIRSRSLLTRETLRELQPAAVLLSRGMPLEDRRIWATAGESLRGKTILIQGTGTGWDAVSWAALRPAGIIATDLYSFEESWTEIKGHCASCFGVGVDFRPADLVDHGFIPDASVDLCASDAVYEHCQNLAAVMRETHRVLKPDGRVYATYGPMWYCAGGDHFARG